MPDLLLQLTPTTAIRGTTAHAQSTHVFAVYDFIDLVARPPSRDQPPKRGPFSRDVWARLTHTPFGRPKTALESLASLAPIRASATLNRTTDMPVMTVPGLLQLLHCVMHDAQRHTTISDHHKRHVAYVQETLENFQKGDFSVLQTLTQPAPEIDTPEIDALEADAPDTASHHKKTKNVAAAATDVMLRLPRHKIVFGTAHPVHEHVFSVYQFIDVIGRQLHSASHCVTFARRFWQYTLSTNFQLASASVMAPIRCSETFARRTKTPALNVHNLIHLLRMMLHHRQENGGMYKGKRINKIYVPVDHNTVAPVGEILDAYLAGDRSMIDNIIQIE